MQRSIRDKQAEFKWLIQLYNVKNLYSCFRMLDGKKAVGIDKMTKIEYEENLKENLNDLLTKMKKMSYRPQPVKEVRVPKEGKRGEYRPLGISVFEDKIVQKLTALVLESIYEPIFLGCSYGFRPGRSCHMGIKELRNHLFRNNCRICSFLLSHNDHY